MASVYDDVFYVESLKDMENEADSDEEQREKMACNCHRCLNRMKEHPDDVNQIFELINEKKMFEKLLEETLEELNKTNPCLESGKYHMLCIYVIRYNKFINRIENIILWYEWRKLCIKEKSSGLLAWSWKLMSYYFAKREKEPMIIEKNKIQKKKD